jgi:hypothetical protein
MSNEEMIERIAVVNPVWAETMRANQTEFTWQPIPFYRNFQLLLATVSLTRRLVEFHYADDGSQICVLRGTPEYIYAVNQLESLQLDAGQVPAYVRFFFDNLTGPRIAVVERPEDVRWFEPPESDPDVKAQKEQASSVIHPMRVTPVGGDGYSVVATAVAGTRLKEVDLVVQRDGHVDVNRESVLVEDLPVVEVFF